MQVGLWHATQDAASAWFLPTRFFAAWALSIAACALLLLGARWLPAPRWTNAAALLVLLTLVTVLYVSLGAAMAAPPRWDLMSAGPIVSALGVAALGLWLALLLLHGPRRRAFRSTWMQRIAGAAVFAVAWLGAQG